VGLSSPENVLAKNCRNIEKRKYVILHHVVNVCGYGAAKSEKYVVSREWCND
jgi:ribosomal protein L37E